MFDYAKTLGFLIILSSFAFSQSEVVFGFGSAQFYSDSKQSISLSSSTSTSGVLTEEQDVQYSLGLLAQLFAMSDSLSTKKLSVSDPIFVAQTISWKVPDGQFYQIVVLNVNGDEDVLLNGVGTGEVLRINLSDFKLMPGYQILRAKAGVYSWSKPVYNY